MNALTHDMRSAAATTKAARVLDMQAEARIEREPRTTSYFVTAMRVVARWWSTRREAARLASYPDRMLKDIGVSRAGIPWAVRYGRCEQTRLTRRPDPPRSG